MSHIASPFRLKFYDPSAEPRPQDKEPTRVTIPTTTGLVQFNTRIWSAAEWRSIPEGDRPPNVLHYRDVCVVEYTVN